ncbi:cellulose binding domain-containing protein [Nonomuraea sp. NPDC049625]|uniref:cellulose binding domain-containing protein n=1 Tax=Nonomuraea sp. NPDC049625 TaxID=3155775 RepID=UPI0034139D7D
MSTTASAIGLTGDSFTLRDTWTNAAGTSTGTISAAVPSHGTVVYRVSGGTTSTPTPTPTPTPSGCTATYRLVNDWGTGFQSELTVTNNGPSALDGWTVKLTLAGGQTITSLWNGVNTGTTGAVTVKNTPYNGSIAANGTTTFGFTANGNGSTAPTGVTCTTPTSQGR